jgi:integral membrane protein
MRPEAVPTDPTRRFRKVAFAEGLSLLALLLIAMPLKYAAGLPIAVRIVGSIHGALFLWYAYEAIDLRLTKTWTNTRLVVAMIASSVPFGTFWLDARLRRESGAG